MTQAMHKNNVTKIFFEGFQNSDELNLLFFILLLVIYCVTICGNLLIITLVSISKTLQSPMYFFLTQLSIAEIIVTSDITPNMLNILVREKVSISFSDCITQYFFFALSGTAECLILTVMSYDRYLAICSPLHYASIMNKMLCIKSVFASWLLSCSMTLILIFNICQLHFCGPNIIDHFFCDLNPLMELSCSDTSIVQLEATLFCIPVVVLPFLVIVASYTNIVLTILKIASFSGRLKSFSTCSSHLAVVVIFYGTLFATYMLPRGGEPQMMSKGMSVLYTVFTPFLNPFIYSLRNKDIKGALGKVVHNLSSYYLKSWMKIR